ncbi:MAG: hypothetical protein AA931_06670 [Peptococcaceae bacterium 1109]|nr:MAG: hypothetical protein AA931_06670 [Peptococcaceae bacterium 1109]
MYKNREPTQVPGFFCDNEIMVEVSGVAPLSANGPTPASPSAAAVSFSLAQLLYSKLSGEPACEISLKRTRQTAQGSLYYDTDLVRTGIELSGVS